MSYIYPLLLDPESKQAFSFSTPPTKYVLFPEMKHSFFLISQDTDHPEQIESLYYSYHYCCTIQSRTEVSKDCLVHLPVLRQHSKADICLNYPYPTTVLPYHPQSENNCYLHMVNAIFLLEN